MISKVMKAITINELYKLCTSEIKEGNGSKKILISGDDEGNSYHELFYGFTDPQGFGFDEPCMASCLPFGVTAEKAEEEYIILG